MTLPLNRRQALAGAATVGIGAPLVSACSADEPETATDPSPTGSPEESSSPPEDSASPTDGAGEGVVSTADVPVGGGVVLTDEKVVIAQPTEGDFVGYSAVCTHQGCTVTKVENGLIVCPCHMSAFSVEDGAPQDGPATSPLGAVQLNVQGDQISLA